MPHCQTYIKALRNLGYRITPQREMIIEALAHSPHHMTAEEVYAAGARAHTGGQHRHNLPHA